MHLKLQEPQTLFEIERLCLKEKPKKAPGLDGIPSDLCKHEGVPLAPQLHAVVMKAMITGVEPFAFKGGKLCAIHKGRGDVDEAESYRGILLSNTFAKITHAWARRRLLPTLIGRKTIGQLGGLPSQQTGMGIQAVRSSNTQPSWSPQALVYSHCFH